MSKATLTNNDIALIMEMQSEAVVIERVYNFWWAVEIVFGIDKMALQMAIRDAKLNGMNKRES